MVDVISGKKLKKLKIQARNRRHHHINLQEAELAEANHDLGTDTAAYVAEQTEISHEERLSAIKSTLRERRKNSMNKWNRFAGTSGAGGRGL